MYYPNKYLTVGLLAEVLREFDWPAPFTLQDDLPDGIVMHFPNCRLFFMEGFEGEMVLEFLTTDTGTDESLSLDDALAAILWKADPADLPPKPRLTSDDSPCASASKVANGVRDLCALVLTYMRPCILGDFNWVERYKAYRATGRIS